MIVCDLLLNYGGYFNKHSFTAHYLFPLYFSLILLFSICFMNVFEVYKNFEKKFPRKFFRVFKYFWIPRGTPRDMIFQHQSFPMLLNYLILNLKSFLTHQLVCVLIHGMFLYLILIYDIEVFRYYFFTLVQ